MLICLQRRGQNHLTPVPMMLSFLRVRGGEDLTSSLLPLRWIGPALMRVSVNLREELSTHASVWWSAVEDVPADSVYTCLCGN